MTRQPIEIIQEAGKEYQTGDQTITALQQENKMPIRIGIIGAGPAGLVTALALESYCISDVEITLLDRNKSAVDYPGVEYGIQKRACLALKRIGVKARALSGGLGNSRISFFNTRTNKKQRFGISTDPDLTICVIRQEFLAALTDLLKQTKIHRQCSVKSIEASYEKVRVLCDDTQDSNSSYEFDLLIAADGIGSIVRKDYFKDENYIHNRGFSCLYMLIEVPEEGSNNLKALANTGESWIVLGKSTTATFFPLGKNRFAVGIGFDEAVQAELWHSAGVHPDIPWAELDVYTKRKIAELLAADCPFQGDILLDAFQWIPDWNSYKIYLWKMRDSDVSKRPYNKHGNVIMIGDAAHAIMPTIGMGASLAIEDAEILGRHISEHIAQKKSGFKSTLEKYASIRVPVWDDLMARARTAARLNFVGIRHRNRFSIGPQVPGRVFWKVVSKVEELIA